MRTLICIVEVISQKGLDHVTVESLVEDITPRARGIVHTAFVLTCFRMCCTCSYCSRLCQKRTVATDQRLFGKEQLKLESVHMQTLFKQAVKVINDSKSANIVHVQCSINLPYILLHTTRS